MANTIDARQPQPMRGADLLVDALVTAGVETIFGLPGDTGIVLYDALYGASDRLRHVLARDERHAVVMADAYARLTNRVGVAEVSSGGGTTYAVGGLGEAFAAGVPVLLITSDIHTSSRNSGALTEIDQLALFAAVSKWCCSIRTASDIPAAVAEALCNATTGRPGPVVIIIPEDVLDEQIEPPSGTCLGRSDSIVPRKREVADSASVSITAAMLAAADRPAIVAGSGVHSSEAWAELAMLAEKAGIPVATTIHGKGAIADSDRWSLGVVGNNGGREYANRYLRAADLVLFVGTRANATDTNSWTGPSRKGVKIAQIDIDDARAGRNFPDAVRLVGDARLTLAALREPVEEAPPAVRERRLGWIAAEREAWRTAEVDRTLHMHEGQLAPAEVIRIVHDVLGPGAIVLADPGTPTPYVAAYWETVSPGHTVISPRGHGPMGYAIPAAVGAALACPQQAIVAFTADGSFAMACGELETVARLELPILYVQFTNHSLGWIKMLQHLYMGGRYFGVDPGPIDAIQVAQACGMRGKRVVDLSDLRDLVAEFSVARAPLYLDIAVPEMMDLVPPVASWFEAPGGHAARPVY